ncbi:M20 family metallopeptidase [Ascidiaceihabitans sp.]|uniref:M20 family metallopeptidase n=1 Tax=Ascidiaceihabitans sp. TaxID=1872644 RepID=UPI003299719A
MAKADALAQAAALFDGGAFETALGALVGYATESQVAGNYAALDAYLDDAITPRLLALGFDVERHAGHFLIGQRIEAPDLTTVLIYGHGDVTHGQKGAWAGDMDPFVLTDAGDRWFGRGTADNKVQHLINLMALEAVLGAQGSLGFNVKILMEMAEEVGSPGLETFCATHSTTLQADVLIASDGPRLQADTPTLFMGSRGAIDFDLSVDLREGAHHSGNWGGLLADPAMILAQALAVITDARGQLLIEAWKPDSLTPAVRSALDGLPVEMADGPDVDLGWGAADLTPAERAYGWNSFAVLAMQSGVPDAPQNAISGKASARCQLRFVVGTDVDQILPSLRSHLAAHGLQSVTVTPGDGYFPATRLDPDDPWVTRVATSITDTTGQAPHILPNLAGSLPNHCFADVLQLPTIWVPHSYRGCNQHAPNEHVLKSTCRDALILMAGLWSDLAA